MTRIGLPDRARGTGKRDVPPEVLARGIADAALGKKAEDLLLLDLHGLTPVTDYFVIGTVSTDVHSRAVEEAIREGVRERFGVKPWHVEGGDAARTWVLIDYVDVVVHLFQPETRVYYDLERLWGDAPREVINDAPARPDR